MSLERIYRNIREVKIQGATNIAKAAVGAYLMKPTLENKKKLLSLRPTEPILSNALNFLEKIGRKRVLSHFSESQEKINKNVLRLIKQGDVIFTHCHSTNVVKALIYAKKHGKKFEVYNTETRPLFQGRRTASELRKAGIAVTSFIDSAVDIALEKKQGTKRTDVILLGADAILKDGIINKVGSETIAELAYLNKIPLYIAADSWKFSPRNVKIEERDFHEVWKNAPPHIKIRNPAFEKVDKKYIRGIISEYGILKFDAFVKKAKNQKVKFCDYSERHK